MKATTIGIDLAKHLFQLHGVDLHGKRTLKRQLKRDQMLSFFSNLPPSLIGMEACGSAHYWANKLQGLGHTVKLMAPQFVKPYVKTNKNDAADAEAICEAVTRPSMRFVPIKNSEQLAILALHRARQGFIKARTVQANQIRGLLAEYGFILSQGITHIGKHVPELLEDSENGLPGHLSAQIDVAVGEVSADRAYDENHVYETQEQHFPEADIVIPPKDNLLYDVEKKHAKRCRAMLEIAAKGQMGWQAAHHYGKRALAELAMQRYKRTFGNRLHARELPNQKMEMMLSCGVLNRFTSLGMPQSYRCT